jgi:hypothetical protein
MKLGGVESTRQAYRDTEQLPWVESLLRDCRFTFRTLAKNPAFTVVALAALTWRRAQAFDSTAAH